MEGRKREGSCGGSCGGSWGGIAPGASVGRGKGICLVATGSSGHLPVLSWGFLGSSGAGRMERPPQSSQATGQCQKL